MIKALVVLFCVMAVVGSLWQINICFDAMRNNWAFRWLSWTWEDLGIYDALDVWYGIIMLATLILGVLALKSGMAIVYVKGEKKE